MSGSCCFVSIHQFNCPEASLCVQSQMVSRFLLGALFIKCTLACSTQNKGFLFGVFFWFFLPKIKLLIYSPYKFT